MSDSSGNLRRGTLEAGHKASQIVVVFCVLAFTGFLLVSQSSSNEPQSTLETTRPSQEFLGTPTIRFRPTSTAATIPTPAPDVPRIGIVAGHWWLDDAGEQSLDVGGVCDEGTPSQLTELEVNIEVAQRVVFELRRIGYEADLLQEWDEKLSGYKADALLSIHADACLYPEASGFKVARVADSQVPEIEDRLVSCLVQRYGTRTGLDFHKGSITPDMTRYHTFYEIAPDTPGAIIEVGFMLTDRAILTQRPDLVAQGIIDGILCFLEGEGNALE